MVGSPILRVTQISDLHLFANPENTLLGMPTAASFQAVLRRVKRLRPQPDLLLLTGDLSQDGSPASYCQVQQHLALLGIPAYWTTGNHDSLETMQELLNQPPLLSDKAFRAGGWQFLLLNSGVPHQVYGELSAASLDWLESQLQHLEPRPTLIALHHSPFTVESQWLDSSALQNPEDLFAVIDRYPQVKLVVFGHVHQEFYYQRRGVNYMSTPSTCIQFAPKSSDFALDRAQPGFRSLSLYSDGRFKTRVERVSFHHHQLDLAAQGY